ncbi:MAG TPA: putative phage abortive infection protein [Allosphingosinicella sp.]|jgi:hypothetical protein
MSKRLLGNPSLPGRSVRWIALVAVAWFAFVVAQGFLAGSGHTVSWLRFDYVLSGQFGDSFGSLSAIFAALAAIGAWRAVQLQQQDLSKRDKEYEEQAALTRQTSFETTFFNLLQLLSQIVESTDIKPGTMSRLRAQMSGRELSELDVHRGKDAFKRLAEIFLDRLSRGMEDKNTSPAHIWHVHYQEYKDDLGHYFRVLYHIVIFARSSCPTTAKSYTNIVRAQLSNSELILLAFNCAYGFGREKFKSLVEEFEFFDNADFSDDQIAEHLLRQEFAPVAFGKKPE